MPNFSTILQKIKKNWLLIAVIFLGLSISTILLLPWEKRISLSEENWSQPPVTGVFIAETEPSLEITVEQGLVAQKLDLGRKIVYPKPGVSPDRLATIVEDNGGLIISKNDNFIVVDLPLEQVSEIEASLADLDVIDDFEVDYPVVISQTYSDQYDWGVERIEAPIVWETTTAQGIRVGIVDTGIDYTHPELSARYVGGYNFINDTEDPFDDHGHGTHVSGIVAADLNDSAQAGVSPQVNIYALKVLAADGTGYISDLVAAIDWAMQNNLNVLNFSLGTSYNSSILENKLSQAVNNGIIIVAAAGNTNGGSLLYPAAYSTVIAVSATDSQDNFASFSSLGAELAAPGVSIRSTVPGGGYATWSGTSMAAPHVTGTIALMLANQQENIRQLLWDTAIDLGSEGRDLYFGHGLVHARFAALGADVLAPLITFLEPKHESVVAGLVPIKLNIQDESGVAEAQLFINNVAITEWTAEPYEITWNSNDLDEEIYNLVVVAQDEFGNEGSVQITLYSESAAEEIIEPTPLPSPTLIPDSTKEDGASQQVRQDNQQGAASERRQDGQAAPITQPDLNTQPNPTSAPLPPEISNNNQRNPRSSEPAPAQQDQVEQNQVQQVEPVINPSENRGRSGSVRGASDKIPLGWWLWQKIVSLFYSM